MHFIGHIKKGVSAAATSSPITADEKTLSLETSQQNVGRKSKSPQISPTPSAGKGEVKNKNGSSELHEPTEPKRAKLEEDLPTRKSLSISPPAKRKSSELSQNTVPPTKIACSAIGAVSPPLGSLKHLPGQQDVSFSSPNTNQSDVVLGNGSGAGVMRCTACDIGFSQMSNFLAHKKYYCRGIQSSSPSPPATAASSMLPSLDAKLFAIPGQNEPKH